MEEVEELTAKLWDEDYDLDYVQPVDGPEWPEDMSWTEYAGLLEIWNAAKRLGVPYEEHLAKVRADYAAYSAKVHADLERMRARHADDDERHN